MRERLILNSLQLLYWPVATTSLHTLGNGTSTEIIPLTPHPNATQTAVVDGITITSPTVYISFQTAWATNNCGDPVGKNHTGSLIGLRADEVSSIHGASGPEFISLSQTTSSLHFYGTWIAASFNYTNLALTPVPLSAYLDQPSCYDEFCPTIYSDYRPVLSVPKQVLSLDPAWSSCDLFWEGIYDPPKALQPTNEAAGPSTPAGYTTSTAAAPSPTPYSPTVTPTALPVTTSEITSAEPESPSPLSADPTTLSSAPIDATQPTSPSTPADSKPSPSADPTTPSDPATDADPTTPSDPTSPASPTAGQDTTATPPAGTTAPEQSPPGASSSPEEPAPSSASSQPVDETAPQQTSAGATSQSAAEPQQSATERSSPPAADPVTGDGAVGTTTPSAQPAPSNAIDALTRSSQTDHSTAPADPTATFTGDDGQEHTVVQSSGNVVVDSTVTVSQGGTTSVSGIGGLSVGSTGVVISQSGGATTLDNGGGTPVPSNAASEATFAAGDQTYTAAQATSGYVVFGNGETALTLSQGATTQLGSQAVSVGPSGDVVLGSSTLAYSPVASAPSQGGIFTASGQAYTVIQASGSLPAVIEGAETSLTVYPGAAGTVDGQTISINSAGSVLVGSQTVPLTALPSTSFSAQAVVTIGGSTYQAASGSPAVIGGSTLLVGGPAVTVNGETVSLGSEGVIIASSGETVTAVFTSPSASQSPVVEVQAVVTLSSRTLTVYQVASSSGIAEFDGTRLFVGGSAVTVDGQTVSAVPSGIVEDGTVVSWSTTTIAADASDASRLEASSLGPWRPGSGSATTRASPTASPSGQQSTSAVPTSDGSRNMFIISLTATGALFSVVALLL